MDYTYQKTKRYFAQLAQGMENLGAEELLELGARNVRPKFRGVDFEADHQDLYHIVYTTRLVSRVLAPLITFDCHSDKYLHKTAMKIPWPELFDLQRTFAISANVSNSNIRHSGYAALKLKDAIVDVFRGKRGGAPLCRC